MPITQRFIVDLIERTGATYIETFIGLLIASGLDVSGPVTRMAIVEKAAVAAVPSALAVVKAGLAKLRGNGDSASLATNV